jgi:hypothetical protein
MVCFLCKKIFWQENSNFHFGWTQTPKISGCQNHLPTLGFFGAFVGGCSVVGPEGD